MIWKYIRIKNDQLWPCYMRKKAKSNLDLTNIPDHPYRILIIGGSGSGKINALLNSIKFQPDLIKYTYTQEIPIKPNVNF